MKKGEVDGGLGQPILTHADQVVPLDALRELPDQEQVESRPRTAAVTIRFVKPAPPYTVGQLLNLPEKTAARLIREGLAEKDGGR